jgi:uncharacterized membrane protein
MTTLILGLAIFMAVHLVPTQPAARAALVSRLGANGYKLAFSLISLVGLVAIVMGYGEARGLVRANPQIWVPPPALRHVAFALLLPAFILLAAAYVPSRVRDMVGHPMLAAMKLWALAHLLVRGDLASMLMFGSFLAFAAYDRVSVKRRGAGGPLGGRKGTARGDAIVLAVGLSAYAAMAFWGHGALIGVPLVRG